MKREINLLTYWQYGIDTDAFDELLVNLNIKSCTCLCEDEEDFVKKEKIRPLNIYKNLTFYQEAKIQYELDNEIINKLVPYERTAMDIVNRWIRSYSHEKSYASVRQIYFIFVRFWNDYILSNNINLMIINIIPHIPVEYIPYALCKAYNIPVIIQGIVPFTVGEKTNYILQPGVEGFDRNLPYRYCKIREKYCDNENEILLSEEMKRYFKQYSLNENNEKKVIYYNEKNSLSDLINSYYSRIKLYINRKDYHVLFNKAKYLIKTRLEAKKFLKKVSAMEEKPEFNKKFLIFALHLQPEATTLPGGGIYTDQMLAIRMISKHLPKDIFLYVKEHPSYWMQKGRLESVYESRSIRFYNEIRNLRNVKLINHLVSSKELLEKCAAVVTVTGTIGFEAIFQGKPVLTFGPTFYEFYPTVFRIMTNEDCKKAIKSVFSQKFSYDKREIAMYLHAVEKYIVPMGMNEKSFIDNGVPEVDDADRIRMVDKITEFYREYYENSEFSMTESSIE